MKFPTKITALVITLFAIITLLFTYKLNDSPPGLTVDEASIGYNAVLLSKTLHDQNGRFLPFFVLTIHGSDWKQPSSIYLTTILFKLFGPSLYILRFASVITLLVSFLLITYLSTLFFPARNILLTSFIFSTIPILLIHSHLAQENIMPLPFSLFWLITLIQYQKTNKLKLLIFAGISLGLAFYSYKGMRAVVPVWVILSIVYLLLIKNKDKIRSLFTFSLSIFPFFAIIPYLELKYAGAVYEHGTLSIGSIYDFLYPYLSSFDPSSLFIKGDTTIWHSTGIHGVFLLTTLPLFIVGLYQAIKKGNNWWFLLVAFFSAPLLFGLVNSVHRFSRLLALVPSFTLITTLGLTTMINLHSKKVAIPLSIIFTLLISLNFIDFAKYYWFNYPKSARASFSPPLETAYKTLAKLANSYHLTPYIQADSRIADGETGNFLEAAYFDLPPKRWYPGEMLPPKSLLMTKLDAQPNMLKLDKIVPEYNYLMN